MPTIHALPIELIDAFGSGIFLLTLLTHADLWWHRRDRPAHWWLALSAAGALAVNLTGAIHRRYPADASHWLIVLNVLGIATALISLYELVQALRGRQSGPVLRIIQVLVFVPILFVPILSYEQIVPPMVIASALFLIAAMIQAIRQSWTGDIETRVLARGLVVLFVTLIYDMLSELKWLPRVEGMPILGFSVLFISAARALSLRYDREYQELQALRNDLETRVRHRTRELEAANSELDRLSGTDSLTGLSNRRRFLQSGASKPLEACAVLMLDVDHFKRINDTHGHDAGDLVLQTIGALLARSIDGDEIAARWGGEEFVLLLKANAIEARAERLRHLLETLHIETDGARIAVSASFGLSPAGQAGTLEQRLSAADRALYRAKQGGRNRIEVAL